MDKEHLQAIDILLCQTTRSLTNQIAINIDILQGSVIANHVCKAA